VLLFWCGDGLQDTSPHLLREMAMKKKQERLTTKDWQKRRAYVYALFAQGKRPADIVGMGGLQISEDAAKAYYCDWLRLEGKNG
jgi:hypothetical protein